MPPKPIANPQIGAPANSLLSSPDNREPTVPLGNMGRSAPSGNSEPSAVRGPARALRIAEKPLLSDDSATPAAASATTLALYGALNNATPGGRVKTLTLALHLNRGLPQEMGRPVELDECLRGLSSSDRHSVLDAYWLARQRAAEYQVIVDQAQLLDQVRPFALTRRPLDMLRLQAARLTCDADQLDAQIALLEAEFELTRCAGHSLDGAWLLPSTVPHSGPYLVKLNAQRPEVSRQPAVQHLAKSIPALSGAIEEQAAAVVDADGARATAAAAYQAGGLGVDSLLSSLHGQTVETLAFLQMLTGYNRSIAEYALAVLPPAIPGDQLVQTLVIIR